MRAIASCVTLRRIDYESVSYTRGVHIVTTSLTDELIDGDRVGLLDWDEARVDSPLLDLGALPEAELAGLPTDDFRLAQRAAVAWEVAVCWQLEGDYARRRLKELRELGDKS